MGRLEEVDLSLSLGKREEKDKLSHAWKRLAQLRLTLAGLLGDQGIGPPLLVLFEGWQSSIAPGTAACWSSGSRS